MIIIYKANYEHQYIDLYTIIRGIPHKIKKSEIPKIVKDLNIKIISLPSSPTLKDIILLINDTIEVTWEDIQNIHISFDTYSPYSSNLKRRLSILLRGKKFRWIVDNSAEACIHLRTQILELSRQGQQ